MTETETTSETIDRLQEELARARQTIEAQQLAYRAMVADYQHCANTLQEVSTRLDIATASNGRLRWLLGQIMDALPANRDWLDPQLEREAVIAGAQEHSA